MPSIWRIANFVIQQWTKIHREKQANDIETLDAYLFLQLQWYVYPNIVFLLFQASLTKQYSNKFNRIDRWKYESLIPSYDFMKIYIWYAR